MMRFLKNKKAQNVAEYAILIALVVGAIIAMQTFVKRTMQGRLRDASQYLTDNSNFGAGGATTYSTGQYEPYYTQSNYATTRTANEMQAVTAGQASLISNTDTTRTGSSNTMYDTTATIGNGIAF
ncbi:MAG: hypothetical protein PHY73_00605 [Candidatus Omnitrophica bacterium]|nr:hypothetical protein [Candidatus Omnitrophota bacterium]